MTKPITIILPRRERFSRDRFGAVALTVEAYVRHSALRNVTQVLGSPVSASRDEAVFAPVAPRYRWWRKPSVSYALACAGALSGAPPRHVDVHNRVELLRILARRFPNAVLSLWLHNDPQGMSGAKTAAARQEILGAAQFVICVSEWVRARFIDGVTYGAERVLVFPNVIDEAPPPPAAKEKLIVYVGRIMPYKGVLPLAEAVARVLPSRPDWRVEIVGGARSPGSAYERKVRAAVAGLGDRVAFRGFLAHEEAMATLSRAAIAVVPSQWDEPFGRTALEAMSCGCAVIAGRRGGLPEVVGDDGILIDAPDAAHLAAAMDELTRDDARAADLQARARTRALAAFDAKTWAGRLDTLRRDIDPALGGPAELERPAR